MGSMMQSSMKMKIDKQSQHIFLYIFCYQINMIRYDKPVNTSCESYHERKFYIKYQQNNAQYPKTNHRIYSSNEEPESQSFLVSQNQHYADNPNPSFSRHYNISTSSRVNRVKRNLTPPTIIIGSMHEIFHTEQSRHEWQEPKENKEYSRIPIQFYDQKANGCLADLLRMKVIYRGYAAKNSLFFIKHLSANNNKIDNLFRQELKLRSSDYQLRFDSKFQSGNLSAAVRKSQRQFWLFMREDTNTNGLRQWFHFSITNRRLGKFKFRIYKFSKYYSLYREGMRPFICEQKSRDWKQGGENVKYEYDDDFKCYFLEFEYVFDKTDRKIFFAAQPPYTYSILKQYLSILVRQYSEIKVKKIGSTLAGFDIPLIQIATPTKKQAIILLARTHPGQTASNYSVQSFIQRLMALNSLRNAYNFYIVPMVNPDGVFFGNHRTSIIGQDLNRNFKMTDVECFPEVQAVQRAVGRIKKRESIKFLIDLHGHSARKNIFAYGDYEKIGSPEYLESRILPKLLSDLISTFRYDYCVFKSSKEKNRTARLYFKKRLKINSITIEQSYGLFDEGLIGISHWKNFGTVLADSLDEYRILFQKEKEEGLKKYLKEEIRKDEQRIEKRKQRERVKREEEEKQEMISKMQILVSSQSQKDDFPPFSKKDNLKDFLRSEELKPNKVQNNQTHFKNKKAQTVEDNFEENFSSEEGEDEELDSGDEDLELCDEELQNLKKQIIKTGCLKEKIKRQTYNMAEKKIEMKNNYAQKGHELKTSVVPRIIKLQMKKKEQKMPFNFNMAVREKISRGILRESVQLPYLQKDY